MHVFENLVAVYEAFREAGVNDPLFETLHLVDLALAGKLRKGNLSVLGLDITELTAVAQKRREGVPLEYVVGRATFMGLLLHCTPDTLIPREETELLAGVALACIEEMQADGDELTIMDIGTGSGNIAVSLALNSEKTKIMAADISPEAVAMAQKNVAEFDLQDRVELHCGDLFAPFQGSGIEGTVDIVVCNPPYLPSSTLDKLAPEIIDYEPKVALDAGTYGLDIFRRLIADALTMLRPLGVTRLLNRNGGYQDIQYFYDGEQVRVISAKKTGLADQ